MIDLLNASKWKGKLRQQTQISSPFCHDLMASILEQLRSQRGFVMQTRAMNGRDRVIGTYEWLNSSVEIKPILDKLRCDVPIQPLLPSLHGFRSGPKVSKPSEVCRFGLFLLEICCEKKTGLYEMAHQFGVRPRYKTGSGNDYVDAALEQYIGPLFDHLESELTDRGNEPSIDDVAQAFGSHVLSPEFGSQFPKTCSAIQKISSMFADAECDNPWFSAGVLCREAMNTFSQELQSNGRVLRFEELKAGDTKGTLKQAIVQKSGPGKFSESLSNLTCGAWDHVAAVLHRPATTRDEALRAYMWTGLVISEISRLFEKTTTQ